MYVEVNRQPLGSLFVAFVFMLAYGETTVHSSTNHLVENMYT